MKIINQLTTEGILHFSSLFQKYRIYFISHILIGAGFICSWTVIAGGEIFFVENNGLFKYFISLV